MRARRFDPVPVAAIVVVVLLVGLAPRPGAGEGVPGIEAGPGTSEALLGGMNPFLLTNLVSARVVVEVDWIEGAPPADRAIRAMKDVLGQVVPEGKRVDVELSDAVAVEEWNEFADSGGLARFVARFLDRNPSDWEETEVIYVIYAPDSRPWYGKTVSGMQDRVVFDRDERIHSVQTVMLFTGEIRREALLWVTAPKIERAILVHELGHVLGLVSSPEHFQKDQPDHCARSRCVMHQSGLKSAVVNGLPALFAGKIPHRFGPDCTADIEIVKRLWAADASGPAALADRLRERRAEREAWIPAR